jgi:hypothetical protein
MVSCLGKEADVEINQNASEVFSKSESIARMFKRLLTEETFGDEERELFLKQLSEIKNSIYENFPHNINIRM